MISTIFYDSFNIHKNDVAIIWKGINYNYEWLIENIALFKKIIYEKKMKQGSKVALIGDFSPMTIALFFALIENSFIIVPLLFSTIKNKRKFLNIAQVEYIFTLDENDNLTYEENRIMFDHPLFKTIKGLGVPGLVLFTSGTSGEPKATVHNFSLLLKKFKTKRTALRVLNFLLFDHWGGLNTMFHIFSNGGSLIATKGRTPENICRLIERYKIQLLPTSPTFLNLLLISEAYKNHDLSSLKIISYGTEPMPESTLNRLTTVFPHTKFLQTYGLIELGVMKSRSENNNSLWVKIEGEGYKTRIINGILQIKSESAMLGYLNAPSPFTKDGWFVTGDEVLQKGEYIKILGRKSEIINVGGEKVYPQEVESVIQEMKNVVEVTIYGEKNSIVGNIICAKVRLKEQEERKLFILRLKKHCMSKLQKIKIPVKVIIDKKKQYNDRFKKNRN